MSGRYELADGLRGLGTLAMVMIHVAVFTMTIDGDLLDGVLMRLDVVFTLFFILSAFLLYRPMISHRMGGSPPPAVRVYAVRRFLRIYPAYWIALTVLALFGGVGAILDEHWAGAYTVLGNFDPPYASRACGDEIFTCGLPQTWSLTVEVTFYAFLPLYAWLANRMARGRPRESWVRRELVLIGVLSLLSGLASMPFRDEYWFRYSLLGNFGWLGIGLAFAIFTVAWNRGPRPRPLQWLIDRPGLCWAMAGLIWLALLLSVPGQPYIVARDTDVRYVATLVAFGAVGALMMLPVAFVGDGLGFPRRLLASKAMGWYGKLTFGVFLWHVTIAYYLGAGGADGDFATVLVLTVLLSTPLAAASWYLIEKPLSQPRRRRRPVTGAGVAGPIE